MVSERIWHLVARKLSGEASAGEIKELEDLLRQDPGTASQVEIHEAYFRQQSPEINPDETDRAAWQKQLVQMQKHFPGEFDNETSKPFRPALKKTKKPLLLIVCTVITLAVAVWFFANNYPQSRQIATQVDTGHGNLHFGKGRNVLPDGTIVWVNSNSSITCKPGYGQSNRDIMLSGEAYFDVTHRALPLVVHAGPVNITVKGTAFNVRSYPGDSKVETALIRGVVELSTHYDAERKILLKPNEKIVIYTKEDCRPAKARGIESISSQPLVYEVNKLTRESQSRLIPEIAWLDNKLVFNSEPLADLAERMGRWYNVSIHIEDESIAREKFTGVFQNESLEEALNAMQLTYSFRYSRKGNIITIQK
jgi:ferric-dicitrate binding protein FerR (iron transport regulator)